MTQDFAKQNRNAPPVQTGPPRWVWFITGFFAGSFLTFLGALWYFVPGAEPAPVTEEPVARLDTQAEEMQWDFYEIFPKSVVPVVEEYDESGQKVVATPSAWLLQTGSFTDPNDADELRASLILMGLSASITEVEVSGKTWHRVMTGPFETKLERNRAQDKLAQAEIKAIAIAIQN